MAQPRILETQVTPPPRLSPQNQSAGSYFAVLICEVLLYPVTELLGLVDREISVAKLSKHDLDYKGIT